MTAERMTHDLMSIVAKIPEDGHMDPDALARVRAALVLTVPRGWKLLPDTTYDERSWPQDGNYSCCCCYCGRMFTGHKRRVVCRACS